ncbi:MAG: NAD+ synthase [Balneolaceae bacterium]|nr:NAD+ synthase [Balneolaceae bacterium]
MKIRLEQLNPIIGDIEGNTTAILQSLDKAESDGIDLLILPELVVAGYPAQDLYENSSFREACYAANEKILLASKKTAILFGSITPNQGYGRKMYNSALLASEGKLHSVVHKTLLPTYDVFDDFRYFEPNKEFKCVDFDGINLGITICEDIWYNENEVQYHTYESDPAARLAELGADLIINVSASPYTGSKHENRKRMLQNHAKKLNLPVLYSNQTGSHTDIVFDGDTMGINSRAEIIATTRSFTPDYCDLIWNFEKKEIEPVSNLSQPVYPRKGPERHFEAIKCGLSDYFKKTGITARALVGLSGGIDSALVCTIAADVLGPENVVAITMPSEFSSEGSVNDSQLLAKNLGVELHEVSIESLFSEFTDKLKTIFEGTGFGVAEENLQSRIRGTLLMAYSNKFGHFLLTTGNKSEYAVGYATLYGDMNGALGIIGDLYKTEVFEMAKWLNSDYFEKEIIPENTIHKPPSAELRPDQKDSDSLPDYEVLDNILYRYIELLETPRQIVAAGHQKDVVSDVLRLVDFNEFKRYQAAPILKLSSKSFGSGRRWPIVQRWTLNNKF